MLEVTGMTMTDDPLFGAQQRLDANGKQSALVKVMIPVRGCQFEGSTIGSIDFKGNHYWLWFEQGVKRFRISCPGCAEVLEVNMAEYFPQGVEGKRIYELKLSGWSDMTPQINRLIVADGEKEVSDDEVYSTMLQARNLVRDGKCEEAIELCTETLGHTSNKYYRSDLFDVIGWAYDKLDQPEQMLWAYQKGMEEDPKNAQVVHNLAVSYYYDEQYENAEILFTEAFHNKLYSGYPIMEPLAYAFLGASQMELDRAKEAETNLLKAIELDPWGCGTMPYYRLGTIYAEQERYQEAADMIRTGLGIEPEDPANFKKYFGLGILLLRGGKKEEATDALEKCTSIAKEIMCSDIEAFTFLFKSEEAFMQVPYYYGKAQLALFRICDEPLEQIKLFKELYEFPFAGEVFLEPGDYLRACWVYKNLLYDRKSYEEYLAAVLERFPDNPDVLWMKAQEMGFEEVETIDTFKKILEKEYVYEPMGFDYATVYNNIAWGYCLQGKYNEALPYSIRSVRMNKNHDYSWETLGEIYWYTENYEGCIDAMTRCIDISKEKYPEAYRFRGNSLIKLGKAVEGKKDLKKADKLEGK